MVQSPDSLVFQQRMDLKEYLQIVAATNYKQRMRKTVEYFHADRLNYAVVGTPNRLEYDQGFFVKMVTAPPTSTPLPICTRHRCINLHAI